MLENLNRRTQARDFDPNAREPGYRELFEAFIEQDVEAETLLRQREKMTAYEQGRTDIKMGIEFGIIPVSGRVAKMPDTIRPAQPVVMQRSASLLNQALRTSTAGLTPSSSAASMKRVGTF